jgi:anhydro-N-acetylmuramic acid kinase
MSSDFVLLKEKETYLGLGVISGTSADGLDVALVDFSGERQIPPRLVAFKTFPYPEEIRQWIQRVAAPEGGRVEEVCRLHAFLGHHTARRIVEFLRSQKVEPRDVDFIGSHGQTVCHLPEKISVAGIEFRSTLQLGDPSVIAQKTGILTVGDFRTSDVALGGEGAPLVPLFDWYVYTDPNRARLLVNLGGIGNLTFLPPGAEPEDVIGFDFGPANVLLDHFSRIHFGTPYDPDGRFARKGKINSWLLSFLMKDPFFHRIPPKSTGREYYLGPFLESLKSFPEYDRLSGQDLLATLAEFTACSLRFAVEHFLPASSKVAQIILSGGGARNSFLVERIRAQFHGVSVLSSDSFGFPDDAKEAACFAFLAFRTLKGLPANLPRVTGAERTAVLGKICLPC